MKILFINPPVTRPLSMGRDKMRLGIFFPLGLAYLVSYLKEKFPQWQVVGFDALLHRAPVKETTFDTCIRYGAPDEEIIDEICSFQPDVVGVSCLFPSAEGDALSILRLAKALNPSVVTLMGGVHSTNNAQSLLEHNEFIDYIVLGEGEETAARLISSLERKDVRAISAMTGVAFCIDGIPKVHRKGETDYIKNLDVIPFPDRTHFSIEKYLQYGEAHAATKQSPYTQVLSSRGCPLRCTYCSLRGHWGFNPRFRSAQNVVDEIEYLVNEHGVREVHFEDDNFTANKKRALEIFDLLSQRKINVSLSCPSGTAVAHLDEELIHAMASAGFYSISLGIESGDPYVLKNLMKKNVDLEKVPRLIKLIRDAKVDVRAFFILGYPGESEESILGTVNFAKSLLLDWVYFFIFTPYPNTPVYKTCVDNGYIIDGEYDRETYNFRKTILKNTAWDPLWLESLREEAIIDCNFKNNVNVRMGNYAKAIADIGSVVASYPDFGFATFYLADVYIKMGDRENAQKYLQCVKENDVFYEMARDHLRKLGSAE